MTEEILVYQSRIQMPYAWSAGATGSRFLKALRDEKKFLATRCPKCRKTHFPPLKTCGPCFCECDSWVEVGPNGTLLSFTQALYDTPAHSRKHPIYGLIQLDGADTPLLHFLDETSLNALNHGLRVEPVFAPQRTASILDISYFRPLKTSDKNNLPKNDQAQAVK